MATKQELDDIMTELEAMPLATLPTYKHSRLEHVAAWLVSKVIHNADSINERFIRYIANVGKKFVDEQSRKEKIILKLPEHIYGEEFMREYREKEAAIRKEIGTYDSTKFLDVWGNMATFCREFSEYGDRNMMSLGLQYGAARGIAAYFFRPVFYWDLLRHMFRK